MRNAVQWFVTIFILIAAWLAFTQGWFANAGGWLDDGIRDFSDWWKDRFGHDAFFSYNWNITALIGVVLASLIGGTTSSLVVSNRMAFFSDAIAHCAFAGLGLGFLLSFVEAIAVGNEIAVMIAFGVLVGIGIAFVKEKTTLANDTVIGVFFAAAMALGAILLTAMVRLGVRKNPEADLFGDPLAIGGQELILLTILLLVTCGFLYRFYNQFVFVSFNPSLARSRNFPVRLSNYLFIILLGLIVNICFKVVGILLVSALLVLPAAAASNVSRNLRQFFWFSTAISLASGLIGLILSNYALKLGNREIPLPSGGTIILIGSILFFVSMLVGRWIRGNRPSLRAGF